jgi:integrase/recombinase XerC
MIRSWIVPVVEMKIENRSVNRKIVTLRTFYKFLYKKKSGQEKKDPMLKIGIENQYSKFVRPKS